MKHKKQHIIPQTYMSAWLDDSTPEGYVPYVWVVDITDLHITNKAPKNIFHETDYYTFTNAFGDRDMSLEHGLSQLEGMYASIHRDKISQNKPLASEDHIAICAFISAMHARTPKRMEEILPFWEEAYGKLKYMAEWQKQASPEQLANSRAMMTSFDEDAPSMSMFELEEVLREHVPNMVPPEISAMTPLLAKLDMAIYETTWKPGFISSDNPCAWHDPEGYKRPYPHQGPALMYPSIEITMPVSPKQAIFLNRRGINGYVSLRNVGIDVELDIVRKINFRTRLAAKEYVVVNQEIILWDWFFPRPS